MIFLREKTDGLTHAESVLQPPFPGLNCLNWNVGHIATFRNRLLQLLGEDPVLGKLHSPYSQAMAARSGPVR